MDNFSAAPLGGTARSRGRPRSFDIDRVTDLALGLFWERGFEGTNLDDIIDATGVKASSLYAAFGSKRGIFHAAMDRYQVYVGEPLDLLATGTAGVEDVARFVEWVRAGIVSDSQPSGCLVVNTMVELAVADAEIAAAAAHYRERVRVSLSAALGRAERLDEIEPGSSSGRAMLVQATLFGALATGRAGAIDEAEQMLRGLLTELRRWRARRSAST